MAIKTKHTKKGRPKNAKPADNYDLDELLKFFGIARGMVVADIGCGSGEQTIPMAAIAGDRGKVYALNVAGEALDPVREKIDKWDIHNIVPLLFVEDNLPLEDNTVDFVLLPMLVHKLDSYESFFHEIDRILKRGGKIGIIEWKKSRSPEGPPPGKRISPDKMKQLLGEHDFTVKKEIVAGKHHYAFVAARSGEIFHDRIEKIGEKLVSELLCISEKGMRSAVLAERFSEAKPEVVVEIMYELCLKAAEKKARYVEVLEGCMDMDRLREVVGLEKLSKIYGIAKDKGYNEVVRLLMNPSPKGKKFSKFDFVEGRDVFDVTLGEKRSLAKGRLKDTLDRLLYDEDPTVIRSILSNPRITEMEVLKIASKRPIKPEILKVIFESKKWSSRYVVKRALVLNPCTPTGIALGLVNFMQYADLKRIATNKTLHEEICTSAAELLKRIYKR